MKTFGATTFMIGLGQAMFQFYLLLTGGYWSRFTIADFMTEIGIYSGYGYAWWEQLAQRLLGLEFSFALMTLGVMVVMGGPVGRLFQAWHAERLIQQTADHRPTFLHGRRLH